MGKELYPLFGVITTVITPFNEDLSIDFPSLRREIDTACKAGVGGFLVPCLASELPQLNAEERIELTKAVVDEARGRAKVIAGIAADTQEGRIKNLKTYMALGVDGINALIPFTTREEYRKYIEEIDSYHPEFLCIQDADFNGPGMPVDFLAELFRDIPSFKVAKVETKNCGEKYGQLLKATNGKLNISSGWGNDQMIEALDRGIHSIMPSGLFELFTGVYKRYAAGNREAAKKLFFDILPIITFTRQGQSLNRKFHKRYMKAFGIFDTDLSREPVQFDEYDARYADELIERAKNIIAHLDEY
ncbi:MAG: dihydrodipicolinate synthase family protein [Erysipelotrichales bacterium]|nr:dihydrodipicolinate synthase family protein [Erysipelotrichales bacterium]